jgi:hypothetical protein
MARYECRVSRPNALGRMPYKLPPYHTAIQEQVNARPDVTLKESRAWLLERHKVFASIKLIWGTFAQFRLTLKKDPARGGAKPTGRGPRPNRMP